MKLKNVLLSILFVTSCVSFAQEFPIFKDSHGLIDTSVAEKLGISTEYKLMLMADKDFEGMLKSGLVNRERCNLFQINDHVDFCDYFSGGWDVSYIFSSPNSERAKRELEANKDESLAWTNILASIKIHNECLSLENYDKDSGIISIKEHLAKLTKSRTVRDCSPEVRILLPERVKFATEYLKSH